MRIEIHIDWDKALRHHPDPLQWIKDAYFQGYILKICSSEFNNWQLKDVLLQLGVPERILDGFDDDGGGKIKLFYGPFPEPVMINKVKYDLTGGLPTPDLIEYFAKEQKRIKDAKFKG